MNNIYKRGLFKRFLKDWTEVIFERQQAPTKQLRAFTSVKKEKNDYNVENEKWYPRQLSSGENYNNNKTDDDSDDLLWLLNKQDKQLNERED